MKNLFLYLLKNPLISLPIVPIIFFFITFDNPYYSDDHQTIIGIKLYNLIQDQSFLSIKDLFSVRSDGHLIPVLLIINNLIPANYFIFHAFVISTFLISIYLVYLILIKINLEKETAVLSAFFYSIYFSINIKPLVWNVFHSHITNSLTGLSSILIFLIFLEQKKLYLLLFYLLLASISILNSETGIIYPIGLFIIYFLFYDKKLIISLIIVTPIILFFILLYFLSGDFYLLSDRTFHFKTNFFYFPNLNENFKQVILEYRSRQSPNNFFGYAVIFFDNILNILNISSYEYIWRSLNNWYLKFLIILIFLFSIFSYLFLMFKVNFKFLLKSKIFLNFTILLFLILILYSVPVHRSDLCVFLAFPSSVLVALIIKSFFIIKQNFFAYLAITIFTLPSLLYAFTGFNMVYEMRSRDFIKLMSQSYYDTINEEISYPMVYEKDFINLYCYKNYDKFKSNLSDYKDFSFYEFENLFSQHAINKLNPSKNCSYNLFIDIDKNNE